MAKKKAAQKPANDHERQLKETVDKLADILNAIGDSTATKYRYVLVNGKFWKPQPFPKGYPRGLSRLCFEQSQWLANDQKDLRYVEGYAICRSDDVPVHHGWCVDQQDRVIDVTWDKTGLAYLGVVFDLAFVRTQRRKTGTTSVLDSIQRVESSEESGGNKNQAGRKKAGPTSRQARNTKKDRTASPCNRVGRGTDRSGRGS